MNKFLDLKINNSKKAAVQISKTRKLSDQWKDPGAKLYNQLLGAQHIVGNKIPEDEKELDKLIKEGKYLSWNNYLEEAYMIAPIKDIKNSPYGVTPFNRSGCKYPHHVIKNGELVVSIPGLRAAYICARNQGVLVNHTPENKNIVAHFNRHFKELGLKPTWHHGEFYLLEESTIAIEKNLNSIYKYIGEKMNVNLESKNDNNEEYFDIFKSELDDDFKPKEKRSLSEFKCMKITNELTKKYKNDGSLIKFMRDYDPKKYPDECLIWIDSNNDYVCSLTYDTISNPKDGYTWISGIDTAYKYRGCGLGGEMIDYAIAHGVDALNVQYDNEVALKLYLSKGFKITPDSKVKVDSGLLNTYALTLNGKIISEDEIIGDTPEKLYNWMHKNISYTKDIKGWKLKSASELYHTKEGICHDQSLFIDVILRLLEIDHGQLFFVEYSKNNPIGGNTHTLSWYKQDGKIYWLENAWEDQAGIHGPYKSIDELKNAIFEIYNTDIDINSNKYDGIVFGEKNNYKIGMGLGEYVESWKLDDDKLFSKKNLYDPPLEYDKLPDHLKKDEVHAWRAKTGIELIHKEPTLDELNRIWKNWQLMTDEQKHISDKKSLELFGLTNEKHYKELLKEYDKMITSNNLTTESYTIETLPNISYSSSSNKLSEIDGKILNTEYIDEQFEWLNKFIYDDDFRNRIQITESNILNDLYSIINPFELLKFMDNIKYGWYSIKDGSIHGTGDEDDEDYFYKYYRLQSPKTTIERQVGVCWDQVEVERKWFIKHSIPYFVIYIEIDDGESCPTHTCLIYKDPGDSQNVYWFEHSWGQFRGIHKYDRLNKCISDIVLKHVNFNSNKGKLIVTKLRHQMKPGLTCQQYMDIARSEPVIDYNDISYDDLFNENYNIIDYKCYECNKLIDNTNVIIDNNSDIDRIKELHPNWDLNNGQLGYIICPYCKTRNDILVNNDIINESTDEDVNKEKDFVPIYGVLKYTSFDDKRNDGTEKDHYDKEMTRFQASIKTLTRGDNYGHALMSFDDSFRHLYSFGDEGIEDDDIMKPSWMATSSIYICVMFVDRKERDKMKKYVDNLVAHPDKTSYAFSNLLKAYISKPTKVDKRFVCSTFTGYAMMMSNPKNLHRDYSRLRPEDITILPRAFYIMNVKDQKEFLEKKKLIKEKVDSIFEEYHDEIEDYNNHLPKLLLIDRVDKIKFIDKIFDWIIKRI